MTKTNPQDSPLGKKKKGPGRPPSKVPMDRRTYHIPTKLADKISAHAYWERTTISAVLTKALVEFFKSKNIKPKPKDIQTVSDVYRDAGF